MEAEKTKTPEEKHKALKKAAEKYSHNLQLVYEKLEIFYYVMNQLKEACLKPSLPNPFKTFDHIFKNFSGQLKGVIQPLNQSFLQIIKDLQKKIKDKENFCSEIFNEINEEIKKEEALKEKWQACEKSAGKNKKVGYNFFKFFGTEDDEKKLNEALNESNKYIYNCEIDSIKESLKEKNLKYDSVSDEIYGIIGNNSEIILPLNLFSNYIKQFVEALGNLYTSIKNQIQIQNKNIEGQIEQKNQNLNEKTSEKKEQNEFIIIGDDDKKENEKISKAIENIIYNENKLNMQDIVNIHNLLEINIGSKHKAKTKDIFLSKISDLCSDGIVFIKNEDNFVNLGHILNAIFLQEKSTSIFSKIISISNHIKYKKKYLYATMRKNNKYFQTETLWMTLINHSFINKINDYIKDNFQNKNTEKDKEKDDIKKKDRDFINSIFKNLGIEKEILSDLKKLNTNQIHNLKQDIEDYIVEIISNYIPIMNQYLVTDELLFSILKYYRDKINISNDLIQDFKNQILIIKLNSKQVYANDKDYQKFKKAIIISESFKFLPLEEHTKFLYLNKALSPKLNKYIFTQIFNNIFQSKNMSLDLHIKYLGQYLQIYKVKKIYDYKALKQEKETYFKSENIDPVIKKKNDIIQKDIKRTLFIQNNPTHKDAVESILSTFNYKFRVIGYYQGFNVIVSVLYQLLNCDEEKTFYYFYGLQFNTKYNLVFKDKFALLNILFSVFEKIIKFNIPEILDILKKTKVDLDYFCPSWFTTLFMGTVNIINRQDPPWLLIYFIEKFCINSWSAIFNLGMAILEISYETIIKLEKEEFINCIMKIVDEEKIFDNKNFERCKIIYEKYEKVINEDYVEKLIEIAESEKENKCPDDC